MSYKTEFDATCFGHIAFGLATKPKHLKGVLGKKFIRGLDFNIAPASARYNQKDDIIVVMVNPEGCDINKIHALLLHEAVHIFQHLCKVIGEDCPSSEFEAYQIQFIANSLFNMYDKMVAKDEHS